MEMLLYIVNHRIFVQLINLESLKYTLFYCNYQDPPNNNVIEVVIKRSKLYGHLGIGLIKGEVLQAVCRTLLSEVRTFIILTRDKKELPQQLKQYCYFCLPNRNRTD